MEIEIFDSINRQQLLDLLNREAPWYLSIYMPTARHGQNTRQNPIVYKNLVRQVEEKFHNPDIRHQLEEIVLAHEFWQNQNDGLAILMDQNLARFYRLPFSFNQHVNLGQQFVVRPLLPYLNQNGSFLILNLDQSDVSLMVASHYEAPQEIPLPADLPRSFEDYLDSFDYEDELQFHQSTTGVGKTIFHGHGDATAPQKKIATRFFSLLDEQLTTLFNEYDLPLILVATSRVQQLYRSVNNYSKLEEEGISKQPQTVDSKSLQKDGWKIVADRYLQLQEKQKQKLRDLASSDQKSHKLEEIVKDAYQGKIEALFVDPTAHVWGEFNPQKNLVKIHESAQNNSEDLLETAVHWTLKRGGNTYLAQDEQDNKFGITAWKRY